jgi:hypothetical protein
LPNELFDSVFVIKSLLFRRIETFIGQCDLQTRIQKRQLAQAGRQSFKLKLGRDCENRRIRQEGDERACGLLVFDLANYCELVRRFAFGEGHVIDLAFARNLGLKPFRKCVRALRTDAV